MNLTFKRKGNVSLSNNNYKMKKFLIIIITKIVTKILRLLGKNAGNLPGNLALKWDKSIFEYFKITGKVIAVTGTNGKTMTTNCIAQILKDNGKKVISNLQGNNMETGILSTLIKNSSLTGKLNSDYLVFETDESYVPVLYKKIPLDSLIVLNFFRDQLDRNGEMETLILKIQKFLENYTGNVILNADDPNVNRLSKANLENSNIYFYSIDKCEESTEELHEAAEGTYCPFCRTKLQYAYYQYAHVGKFECPKCHYGKEDIYHKLTQIDVTNGTFEIGENKYKTQYDSLYAFYDLAAATAVAKLYEVPEESTIQTIERFVLNNGRLEKLEVKNCKTTINLAKNPTGVNVSLRFLQRDSNPKELLFVLNDNVPDGKDVSWIWDIDFEKLENVERVITAGLRPYDAAIRIKTAGYPLEKIIPCTSIKEAVSKLYETQNTKYVIANYTAIQNTRKEILDYKAAHEK